MTIEEIIKFWNNNYYSQDICINNLLVYINNLNLSSEVENLKQDTIYVLNSLLNRFNFVSKSKVFNTIKFFESIFNDRYTLIELSCILSNEYLNTDLDNLVDILSYWKWSIPAIKNIFISWYYDLNKCENYIEYVYKVYKSRRSIAILQIISVMLLSVLALLFIDSFISFISHSYLNNLAGFIVFMMQYIIVMFILLTIRLVLLNSEFIYLRKIKPKFCSYNVRR